MANGVIHVKNWERFQDRNLARKYVEDGRALPWLKQMTNRLRDYEYTQLHPLSRYVWGELIGIAAHNGPNDIPYDINWLNIEMHFQTLDNQLEDCLAELERTGFIEIDRNHETPANNVSANVGGKNSALEEKRVEKKRTLVPDKPARKPDPLWDTLVAELGVTPTTPSERGRWNKALKGLRVADATPAQIRARCRVYRNRWPNVSLTATALEANWGSLLSDEELAGARREEKLAEVRAMRGAA